MKSKVVIIFLAIVVVACAQNSPNQETVMNENKKNEKIKTAAKKSEQEWQMCLTPEQYKVLREKGTEMAFTGKYYNFKKEGVYKCAACGNELFGSREKYDSGTGWPSFWDVLKEGGVLTRPDTSHGMVRTEIVCGHCGSHLGHVFEDGPPPTGLRYCVNSLALDFEERKMEK
ncbi:MAG TPA: peptide-methionine (R)-S-oxide reductase MsrB [Calditrichaeota bacterium]|nr:peptide-methionine (R)-S-oxide reductase MsrB [Calditrichota bacterium]